MRALLQRVSEAKVIVESKTIGTIGPGLLVFLGIGKEDSEAELADLLNQIVHLRIFEDENHKMNKSLVDTSKNMLCISQFTLYADMSKGRRPSFTNAMEPVRAKELYALFCAKARTLGLRVEEGLFGADMKVHLVNDGPVTLWLESKTQSNPVD
jgi:D-aminoacyl-tRNA deacylase